MNQTAPTPRNGVDTPTLLATIQHVAAHPAAAAFQFRATNRWIRGTHSRTTFGSFSGAGGEHTHSCEVAYDADHPAVLVGKDEAPSPPEFLLHALASCIMSGIANISAARRVTLHEVTIGIEGDIDLQGILGISDAVRNGFQEMRLVVDIRGDASDEVLQGIVEQARKRSAVYDVLTHGLPVSIAARTA